MERTGQVLYILSPLVISFHLIKAKSPSFVSFFAKSALVRTSFLSICATFWFHDILYLTKQSGIETNRLCSFSSCFNVILKDHRGSPQECATWANGCSVMKMFKLSLKDKVTIPKPDQQLVSNIITVRSNCVSKDKS